MKEKITQEEYERREREVLHHIVKIFEETTTSIKILEKTDKKLPKSGLCLAFIAADAFSRFYEVIVKGTDKWENGKRFRFWLDSFVFTEKNKVFKKNKNEINCDSNIAWRLRNSLLHFYGLPPKFKNEIIVFGRLPLQEIKKLHQLVKEKRGGLDLKFVNDFYLIKAILSGLFVQEKQLLNMIKTEPEKYIDGILKCYPIVRKECSEFVNLKKET